MFQPEGVWNAGSRDSGGFDMVGKQQGGVARIPGIRLKKGGQKDQELGRTQVIRRAACLLR